MSFRTVFQIGADALLAVLAISVAYGIRPSQFGPDGELYRLNAGVIAVFVAVVLFSSFLMDVYDQSGKPRKREVLIRVLLAGMAACLPFSVVYFVLPNLLPSKQTVVLGSASLRLCSSVFTPCSVTCGFPSVFWYLEMVHWLPGSGMLPKPVAGT